MIHNIKYINLFFINIKIKNESKYFYLLGDKAYKTKNKKSNFNNNKLKKE